MRMNSPRSAASVLPLELFAERARDALGDESWPDGRSGRALISLSYGFADPALFPREDLVDATAAVMADDAALALNYGPTYAGLVDLIAERMRAKGVPADPERVLVSYGSSQILGLLPQIFCDPGDTVIVEGPTFLGAVRHFSEGGARVVGVPTDAHGLDIAALEQMLRDLGRGGVRPRFIYTIPTFQNPTGVTMPIERRRALLALASDYGTVIVEDDAYGDLRFDGERVPPLAALDTEGRVIYIGTFSKILAPGVRMGWACAHPQIISRLRAFKIEGSSGPFMTRVVARYCAGGRLDAHIADLNQLYRHKRDVMLAAIAREFPAGTASLRPDGGFFIWCRLPDGVGAQALLDRSEEHGVTFLPGTHCFADQQGDDAIRLAFSFQPSERIETAIAGIGAAMRELLSR
jgi:2-aminoadipate transaminase